MPVTDPHRAFPPVQGIFSFKQSSDTLPQSTWTKPGERPIRISAETRSELAKAIGERGIRILDSNIGFTERKSAAKADIAPIFRFETAWGNVPRPKYHCDIEPMRSSDVSYLSNPCTVNAKFFWPNMTNENIDGKHKKHPMVLQLPSSLPDLRAWLSTYGEPDPGKIPTGSMTTFAPSRRRFGREVSKSSQMSTKVDGARWYREYASKMESHYGARFRRRDVKR